MILCGEPSGDLHAGNLVKAIRKKSSHSIYFSGIGGQNLEKQGVDLFYDIENLSVMGLIEVIMQFKQIKQAFDLFKKQLQKNTPDLIILVDYPGFNLRAAKFAKEHYNIKTLYYIAPKVWAWNKSRLKKIKLCIDHAALILPFEEKIYKKANIKATYVGNPLMDDYPADICKPFLRKNDLPQKKHIVIGLLPGSRKPEINNLFEIMIKTAERISIHLQSQDRDRDSDQSQDQDQVQNQNQDCDENQDRNSNKNHTNQKISFIISRADSIKREMLEMSLRKSNYQDLFEISNKPVKEIFKKSDLVIAASGTVTLEAALCCVPTIIIYKMSWLTYQVAKKVVKVQYAGLANLIVNREIMPEFLQNHVTCEKISKKAISMLDNLVYFENQLQLVRTMLKNKGSCVKKACETTADIILKML